MFKQLFRFKVEPETADGEYTNGSADPTVATTTSAEPLPRRFWDRSGPGEGPEPVGAVLEPVENRSPLVTFASFEDIYRRVPTAPPKAECDIRRVAEMINSPHLAGMSSEAKRSSLLMALEAVGVEVEDILQDAMTRLRALHDYEAEQNRDMKEFEASKTKENSLIKAELDRMSAAYMVRIQANLEQVARKEDNLRRWAQLKQQESEQIAATATFCAPQGSVGGLGNLAAAAARYSAEAAAGKR